MGKTIHSHSYATAISLLKRERVKAKVTQVEIAQRMKVTQTYISKCERKERRMDLIESMDYCHAIDLKFSEFAKKLEKQLKV